MYSRNILARGVCIAAYSEQLEHELYFRLRVTCARGSHVCARELTNICNHDLRLWKLLDHIVIHHDLQAFAIDTNDTSDKTWIDLQFLRKLAFQVARSSIRKVYCIMVALRLLPIFSELDVKACNCDKVSQ